MPTNFTSAALEGYREYTERTVSYAKYRIGSTYYKVPIDKVEVVAHNKLAVYVVIQPQSAQDVIISEVQIYNSNNELWLNTTENIAIKAVQEGVLYRFIFEFKEV